MGGLTGWTQRSLTPHWDDLVGLDVSPAIPGKIKCCGAVY